MCEVVCEERWHVVSGAQQSSCRKLSVNHSATGPGAYWVAVLRTMILLGSTKRERYLIPSFIQPIALRRDPLIYDIGNGSRTLEKHCPCLRRQRADQSQYCMYVREEQGDS